MAQRHSDDEQRLKVPRCKVRVQAPQLKGRMAGINMDGHQDLPSNGHEVDAAGST